jgi:hypothetical protein
MWGWLWGRSKKGNGTEPGPSPELEVVMYTRQGCHLCEDAWAILESARQRFRFTLSRVDIDSDPALVALYDCAVPVVTVAGQVRFRGQVNAVLLHRLLTARSDSGE